VQDVVAAARQLAAQLGGKGEPGVVVDDDSKRHRRSVSVRFWTY
jgi:hypothetical protein